MGSCVKKKTITLKQFKTYSLIYRNKQKKKYRGILSYLCELLISSFSKLDIIITQTDFLSQFRMQCELKENLTSFFVCKTIH